ncbi:MAG: CarD family transcriptional regulator [Oscillospiraceae bacterium]|jgi:CarD family transcriptional regulator|nr:CarD family transcriptional regulator [Oscillospiraceae bacterium]
MYEIGTAVICRSGGVWHVSVAARDTITLTAHETGEIKTVPADSDELVRRVVSKSEILDVIARAGFTPTLQAPNDKLRNELYREALAKFDELEWLRVVKTVYLRAQERRLTPAELAFAETAKSYLHGEISVLLAIPISEVESCIAAAVAKDTW